MKPVFDEQTFRLHVTVNGEFHDMHVPYHVVSGIDLDRSTYRVDDEDGVILSFKRIKMKRDFTTELDIFRPGDVDAAWLKLIASDRFRNLYEQNGLTGLAFYPASQHE